MRATLGLAVVLAVAVAAQAHDFTDCSASPKLGIKSVVLTPDPPKAGASLEVELQGKNEVAVVDGASATLTIKMFGVKLASIPFNVCTQMGLTCPVAANTEWTGKISYPIPSAAPPHVSITAEVVVEDASKNELDCVDLKVTVGSLLQASSMPGLARAQDDLSPRELQFLFEAWLAEHSKSFASPLEYRRRLHTFSENIRRIAQHNSASEPHSFEMAMNEFGHLSWDEFRSMFVTGGFNAKQLGGKQRNLLSTTLIEAQDLPTDVDWVARGAVTPVKNQGKCGSCWAFSTVGSIEGAYFIKNGELKDFSEEELVECSSSAGNLGCNGGMMDNAFTWLEKNGLCSEEGYPYTSGNGTSSSCELSQCQPVNGTNVASFTDVDHNERSLMAAVSKQPVSIAIEADQIKFQFYSKGVFTAECGSKLDHGVLLVGYGEMQPTSGGGEALTYWKVKNSWGPTWGLDGYILLQRGLKQDGGQCGILKAPSYPTLA